MDWFFNDIINNWYRCRKCSDIGNTRTKSADYWKHDIARQWFHSTCDVKILPKQASKDTHSRKLCYYWDNHEKYSSLAKTLFIYSKSTWSLVLQSPVSSCKWTHQFVPESNYMCIQHVCLLLLCKCWPDFIYSIDVLVYANLWTVIYAYFTPINTKVIAKRESHCWCIVDICTLI